MSYINKLFALTILGSFYGAYCCTGCGDKLKAQYQDTQSAEDQKCSCSHPKPPRPTKNATDIDQDSQSAEDQKCSCSHPKPPRPTKNATDIDQDSQSAEDQKCSCSHPKPPRPTKEVPCIYQENETITAELVEKIVKLRIKLECVKDKNFAARVQQELDIVSDILKILTEADMCPDETNEKLLAIKKLLNEIENSLNIL